MWYCTLCFQADISLFCSPGLSPPCCSHHSPGHPDPPSLQLCSLACSSACSAFRIILSIIFSHPFIYIFKLYPPFPPAPFPGLDVQPQRGPGVRPRGGNCDAFCPECLLWGSRTNLLGPTAQPVCCLLPEMVRMVLEQRIWSRASLMHVAIGI